MSLHGGAIVGVRVVIDEVHDDGTTRVGASVLGEVVAAGELLATLVALKGLLLCVEGAVVTLEVFLAAEAAVAQIANKGLGGILSQRLLASTAAGRGSNRRSAVVSGRRGIGLGRDGGSASDIHLGGSRLLDVVFASVGLLLLLVAVAILGGSTDVSTGEGQEGERVALLEAQLVIKAAVAEGDDRGSSASTGTGRLGGSCALHVDQVAEVILRVEVIQILESGQAVGDGRVEVKGGLGVLDLGVAQVGEGELGSQSRVVASGDGQVAGVAEVDVLLRGDGASVGRRGRGRQRRARSHGEQVAGALLEGRSLRSNVDCGVVSDPWQAAGERIDFGGAKRGGLGQSTATYQASWEEKRSSTSRGPKSRRSRRGLCCGNHRGQRTWGS